MLQLLLIYDVAHAKCDAMVIHAIVRGRVQGVGFRYFVLQHAQQLRLSGWVRNLPNGRVEVEASGDEDSIDQLEQILWKGPHFSHVEDVAVTRTDEPRDYTEFEVRR